MDSLPNALVSLITFIIVFLGWDNFKVVEYLPVDLKTGIEEVGFISQELDKKLGVPKPAPKPEAKVESKPKTESKVFPSVVPQIQPLLVPPPARLEPVVSDEPSPSQREGRSEVDKLKVATVNIFCRMQRGGQIAHYTGSGVVIDPSGVILTNAHVAEHVMLEQAGHERCFIRTGSPAANSYKAKVVYLPSTWIYNNSNNLAYQNITGNGENDYAILKITERVSANAYDIPMPYIPVDSRILFIGDSLTLIGYPMLSQSVSFLESGLYSLEESSTVTSVSGYDGRSPDVITTSPTPLATNGSSGGAIISSDGKLVGLMDAATTDSYSGRPAIQGITISYIERSLATQGKSLSLIIANATNESAVFALQIPILSATLMQGVR